MKATSKITLYILFPFFVLSTEIANATIDIGATAVLSPVTGYMTGAEVVTIEIYNFGDEPVSDFSVGFLVDGGSSIVEYFTGAVDAGEMVSYTFSTVIDLTFLGTHLICAWTDVAADADPTNDETCSEVISLKKVDLGDASIMACGSVILDAENFGTEYLWSNGETTPTINITESGTYWVQVTEPVSGFVDTDTINVTIDVMPVASFIYTSYAIYNFVFTNTSIGGSSYLWDFGDGETSTEENPTHTYAEYGCCDAALTINNICGSSTFSTFLDFYHAIDESDKSYIILLYPNPANSILHIDNLQYEEIVIYNSLGEKEFFSIHENKIDVSSLQSGMYFIYCDGMAGNFIKE
jgi:PKD domain/Secretion system C-terminal sorting domain